MMINRKKLSAYWLANCIASELREVPISINY